jgi:Tn3 transposase DDE domain
MHEVLEFLYFANRGKIRRKQEEEQVHQAMCLNLLTNCVITWNTAWSLADCPYSGDVGSGTAIDSYLDLTTGHGTRSDENGENCAQLELHVVTRLRTG